MKIDRTAVLEAVRDFVRRHGDLPAGEIEAETLLFQEGYLDSFSIAALIADLQQQLDVSLPAGTLIPEDLESPETLWQRLLEL